MHKPENSQDYERIPALIEQSGSRISRHPWLMKALPWLAGAGIAGGQILVASNCSVTSQGRCSACGSCVIAIGSLVSWSYLRRNQADEFYLSESDK